MPLSHWPCSCYPNHSLGQVGDWMGEIYENWTAAHAVLIATPVYWCQTPSVLKLLIDRMVCADGGNPDPTSEPYATSHDALDADLPLMQEVGNVARTMIEATREMRAGRLHTLGAGLRQPRAK